MPPWRSHLKGGGVAPGGNGPLRVSNQGGACPLGGQRPPRVSNPRRLGPLGGEHQLGLVPTPLQPMGPSGIGGPIRWTPGILPVVPVQYQ